jgi:hypothetical protein
MGIKSDKIEMVGTEAGLQLPVLTNAERDAIVPPSSGMIIYNSDSFQSEVYNGTSWGALVPEKEIMMAYLSTVQNNNFGATQHVQFNTVLYQRGSSISLSTGTGQQNGVFTLPANRTFKITCFLWGQLQPEVYYFLWDKTNSQVIGVGGTVDKETGSSDIQSQPAEGYIVTTSTTEVEVRFNLSGGVAPSLVGGFNFGDRDLPQSRIIIEEV